MRGKVFDGTQTGSPYGVDLRLESLRLCDLQSAVARASVHDKNLIVPLRMDLRTDRLHPSISLSTRMNSVTRKLSDS